MFVGGAIVRTWLACVCVCGSGMVDPVGVWGAWRQAMRFGFGVQALGVQTPSPA